MDRKSKILLIVLIVLAGTSLGLTFWKTVVEQDFEISTDLPVRE